MIDRDILINSWEIFRDKMFSALTGKGERIMPDREKVLTGLELCEIGSGDRCYEKECPYYGQDCTESLKNDILELLKEQEKKPITVHKRHVITLRRNDIFSMRNLYESICETLMDEGSLIIVRKDDHEKVDFEWEIVDNSET